MKLLHFVAALLAALAAAPASPQAYPAKPVRVIVTFPPGGTPDIYGRIMAAELAKVWNQPVVVENRTGAGGTIGTDSVAKSAPDGYTLLFAADASITIAPHLYSKLPYDPVRDFAPVVNVAEGPFVMLAHPSFPANNVPELIALARANPGKYSYASSGAGSQHHLAMETMRATTGIDLVHIPYKGFGQGMADLLASQVPVMFGGITATLPLIRSGKVKALGVTSPQRSKALPDVPAIAETLPGFDIQAWYGFLAPAGTPREIVARINADVVTIVRRPDFQERLARDAIVPVANSPDEFAAQIRTDLARWAKVAKAAGVKLD